MACSSNRRTMRGTITAGTRGTTTEVFFALPGGQMNVNNAVKLNPSYEVVSRTSNLELQGHLQYSNDGKSWTDPVNGMPWTSSSGWQYSSFTSLDTDYRYVRFGVRARTASGQSTVDVGVVRLIVEFQD